MLPLERLKILREVATKLPLANECLIVADHHVGWHQSIFVGLPEDFSDEEVDIENSSCDTYCCLAGWGGTDSRLQADGLVSQFAKYDDIGLMLETPKFLLNGTEGWGYEDLAAFFGISNQEAQDLFSSDLSTATGVSDRLAYDEDDDADDGDYYDNEHMPYDAESRSLLVARIDQLIAAHEGDAA